MLRRQLWDCGNFVTSSSSRLLMGVYLLLWLLFMPAAFSDNVPNATITSASQEIVIVENSDEILQFTCNGNGDPSSKLAWVQGGNAVLELSQDEPGISLSNDSATLVLTINVSEADGERLASREGVPYYCLARNNLGTARSQVVTLRYPSFEGFNETRKNETVLVRIGQEQAVALDCGYVGTPVPKPEVTWLRDNEAIPINTATENFHYRILENGELVIYNLTVFDISISNSIPSQYRCRVDNVRRVETETAPFFYTLYSNEENSLLEDPTVYLWPPASIFLLENEPAALYFIYASNGGTTELVATQNPPFGDIREDDANLRVLLSNGIEGSSTITIHANYIDSNETLASYSPAIVTDTAVTLIEPLVIEPNTTMNQVFMAFTNETTFNFICNASGSQLHLVWYQDGDQISSTGPTLTVPKAVPDDSGVYQCFWTSELRPSQIFDSVSWALAVRDRVSPNVISLITSVPPNNDGHVIVTEGTTVTVDIEVRSDAMPEISWIFTNLDGMSGPLNTSDVMLYETSSMFVGEELYQFNLTLVRMTVENSGWYSPMFDDGFTEPSVGRMYLISVAYPAEVISVVSSHTCLLVGEAVSITCEVRGLPVPTVSFLKNSEPFLLDECQSCNISDNVLTFSMVTRDDQGSYGCTARNVNEGEMVADSGSLNNGMTFVYCDHPEVSVVGSSNVSANEGDEVTLACVVSGAPPPVVTWMFNGTNVNISSDSYQTTQTTNGNYSLIINSVTTSNTGTYTCQVNNTAIPELVMENIHLVVNPRFPQEAYWYIVLGVAGLLFLIAMILSCYWCHSKRKFLEQEQRDAIMEEVLHVGDYSQ